MQTIFSVGCVSMSTLQTARTLAPDQSQQSFGGGVYNSKLKSGSVTLDSNLPYMEYAYRRGFFKDFDAGLKLTIIGAYQADVKYQLLDANNFVLAVGGGLAYMEYKVSSGGTDTNVKYIDAILPLYMSYDFNSSFAMYLSPKYILRSATGDVKGNESLVGVGIGTKIGEKKGVYLEAAVIKGKDDNSITQYNASYFW
jgi:hypothetical protein